MFTSWTVPPAINRRLASPEAVTRSYSFEPCIKATISSEVAAVFTVTSHPVEDSYPVTQSYAGSVDPSSM